MYVKHREFRINDLAVGRQLSVITRHSIYTIQRRADGLWIRSMPKSKYCSDEFTPVETAGCFLIAWPLEFWYDEFPNHICTTSAIQDMEESATEV